MYMENTMFIPSDGIKFIDLVIHQFFRGLIRFDVVGVLPD